MNDGGGEPRRKRSRNDSAEVNPSRELSEAETNPSMLVNIFASAVCPEIITSKPEFVVKMINHHEFIAQVTLSINDKVFEGVGKASSKNGAKKDAAMEVLRYVHYPLHPPPIIYHTINTDVYTLNVTLSRIF